MAATQAEAQIQQEVHELVSDRGVFVAEIKQRIGITEGEHTALKVFNLQSLCVYPVAEAEDPNIKGNSPSFIFTTLTHFDSLHYICCHVVLPVPLLTRASTVLSDTQHTAYTS